MATASVKETALIEVFATFAGVVSMMGIELPARTLVRCRDWFSQTIGHAIDQHPNIWTGRARDYALKQVGRIAGHAATDASLTGSGSLTIAVLDDAVRRVVAEQKPLCVRAKRKPSLAIMGVFCARV